MVKEIQVTCPQCGQTSGHLESEPCDYTGQWTIQMQVPWKCPTCGYPEVVWTKWGATWTPAVVQYTYKTTDENGNEIKLCV